MPLNEVRIRFRGNMSRVQNLVRLYREDLPGTGQGRRPVNSTDVLRAASVLLHASLEDFMRGVAKARWSSLDDPDVLDGIPLPGTSVRKGQKFSLSELVPSRDKTVDRLIKEAIESYLDKSSISTTDQLASMLTSCGVRVEAVRDHFDALSELMARRHHIVHRADHNPNRGQGHHSAKSLSVGRVDIWIQSVKDFVAAVDAELEE